MPKAGFKSITVSELVYDKFYQIFFDQKEKLTMKGADFADAIIRSGDNANDIARVYLSKVPKGQRSASELSELLLRPDIAIDQLGISKNAFMREAAEIAKGTRILRTVAATTALGTPGAIKELGE